MSRGGRGRGGGAKDGVRAVATALGIARQDIGAFTKIITDAPPLFPVVNRTVAPIEASPELQYVVELRQEMITRFQESSFYLEPRVKKRNVRRYTDKYREFHKEPFLPCWSRLPEELNWTTASKKKKKENGESSKKRKTYEGTEVEEKLAKLQDKEGEAERSGEGDTPGGDHPDEEDDDKSEPDPNADVEEQEPMSDDDYLEEDNDYIHTYFDNGENYGDAGSDDNLEDENAF